MLLNILKTTRFNQWCFVLPLFVTSISSNRRENEKKKNNLGMLVCAPHNVLQVRQLRTRKNTSKDLAWKKLEKNKRRKVHCLLRERHPLPSMPSEQVFFHLPTAKVDKMSHSRCLKLPQTRRDFTQAKFRTAFIKKDLDV